MRRWIRPFVLALGVALLSAPAVLSQQAITLENSELKVSISPQNATVLSVLHKRTNASYLGSSKQAGWFRIQIPLAHWEGHAAASQDLKAFAMKRLGPDSV